MSAVEGADGAVEQPEPERDFSFMEMFSLDRGLEVGAAMLEINAVSFDEDDYEQVEVTFDTGAAVSALPNKHINGNKVIPPSSAQKYGVVGGSSVEDAGGVQTQGLNEKWDPILMNWRLTQPGVTKALAAAVECLKKGCRAVLDLETGSYIEHKKTKKRTRLYEKNGVIKFMIWIRKGKEKEMSPFGDGAGGALSVGSPASPPVPVPEMDAEASGFRRLVRVRP